MSDDVPATARGPRRLASVFDPFPPGTPLSLGELELTMCHDIERRSLAALDRALVRLFVPDATRTSTTFTTARQSRKVG